MDLKINGEMRSVPGAMNPVALSEILSALSVRKDLVAVALNDFIVPRAQWDHTLVCARDRVEIVHFVGGGCLNLLNEVLQQREEQLLHHGDLAAEDLHFGIGRP